MSEQERDLLGRKVGHYVLLAPIGEGGMGAVYLAFDEVLHRRVALKRLHGELRLDADAKARFLREARLLSQLDHPNVCTVHDLIEEEDADSIVLELVDGRDLRHALRDDLPLETRQRLAIQLADVLATVHRSGVIHRDLKPENLMVTPEGNLKVLDFGLARSAEEDTAIWEPGFTKAETLRSAAPPSSSGGRAHTTLGAILGTLGYMSPEQARGETASAASDLYSFGLILQELFTGEPAYDRSLSAGALMIAVANGRKREPEGLGSELAALVGELTRLEPGERIDARAALRRLRWVFSAPERQRRRRIAAIWAGVAVAAIALAAWTAHLASREPPLLRADARGRVALLPFSNDTGDPSLDWIERGLRGMVSETLAGISSLEVVPTERIDRACEQLASDPCGGTDEELARLARWVGAEVAVAASFRADGDGTSALYRTATPAGASGSRRVAAADPIAAGEALVDRLVRRLAPETPYRGLRERYSEDPFANRLTAMGLSAWGQQGAEVARDFFRASLRVDPELDWARLGLADCADRLADYDEEERLAGEVRARAREAGDEVLLSASLTRLSSAALHHLAFDRAEELSQKALELARRRGSLENEADAHYQLGDVALAREDWPSAEEHYRASLAIHREAGDRFAEASALQALGASLSEQKGRVDEAAETLEQAIALERELGLRPFEAMSLNSLAITRMKQERYDESRELFERAIAIYGETGNRRMVAGARANLAVVEQNQGRLGAAIEQLEGAYRELEALGDDEGRTLVAFNLAYVLARTGDAASARRYLEIAALRYAGDWEMVWVEARILWIEGSHELARDLLARARQQAGEAWEPELEAALTTTEPLEPPTAEP